MEKDRSKRGEKKAQSIDKINPPKCWNPFGFAYWSEVPLPTENCSSINPNVVAGSKQS